jgi:hypothetical protein
MDLTRYIKIPEHCSEDAKKIIQQMLFMEKYRAKVFLRKKT